MTFSTAPDDDWTILDFKTDEVRTDNEARETIRRAEYDGQVARYARAISDQLKARAEPGRSVQAKTRLAFLNVNGEVKIYE